MLGRSEKSKSSNTKTRIINAAERLFAERGFERTSTHLITSVAGVNQASVNYHFGSKDKLIEKVIMRRLLPISQQSLASLQMIEAETARMGIRPKTEDVLHAFIDPVFKRSGTSSKRSYFLAIVGRAFVEQDKAIQRIFKDCYEPVLNVIFRLLEKSLPEFPDRLLYFRIHFALGAITHTMSLLGREMLFKDFSNPLYNEESILQDLIRFIATGIKSMGFIVEQE